MDTTRIGSQEFTPSEWQSVTNLAKRKEGFHAKLTPQNIIRLALGLPLRQRGGARPNTGNRKAAPATPAQRERRAALKAAEAKGE